MADRFIQFTVSVSKLNKLVQKLKTDGMGQFGLKAVDTLCLYHLLQEDGMLFSRITEKCNLDAALISRTLKSLITGGMVRKEGAPGKYNARYYLTEKGREQTVQIQDIIKTIHTYVDQGISEDELFMFYSVLDKLTGNLEKLTEDSPNVFHKLKSNCEGTEPVTEKEEKE